MTDRVIDQIEPAAALLAGPHFDSGGDIRGDALNAVTTLSIAISLKRLADVAESVWDVIYNRHYEQ